MMESLAAFVKFIFGMLGFAVLVIGIGFIARLYYALFMLGWGALS